MPEREEIEEQALIGFVDDLVGTFVRFFRQDLHRQEAREACRRFVFAVFDETDWQKAPFPDELKRRVRGGLKTVTANRIDSRITRFLESADA